MVWWKSRTQAQEPESQEPQNSKGIKDPWIQLWLIGSWDSREFRNHGNPRDPETSKS